MPGPGRHLTNVPSSACQARQQQAAGPRCGLGPVTSLRCGAAPSPGPRGARKPRAAPHRPRRWYRRSRRSGLQPRRCATLSPSTVREQPALLIGRVDRAVPGARWRHEGSSRTLVCTCSSVQESPCVADSNKVRRAAQGSRGVGSRRAPDSAGGRGRSLCARSSTCLPDKILRC